MVSSDCVQECDQTDPDTAPPLDTWCLVVSNANEVNSVYVSVNIELSDQTSNTLPTPSTSSSTSSTTSSPMTTVVVYISNSSTVKEVSGTVSTLFFFGF